MIANTHIKRRAAKGNDLIFDEVAPGNFLIDFAG